MPSYGGLLISRSLHPSSWRPLDRRRARSACCDCIDHACASRRRSCGPSRVAQSCRAESPAPGTIRSGGVGVGDLQPHRRGRAPSLDETRLEPFALLDAEQIEASVFARKPSIAPVGCGYLYRATGACMRGSSPLLTPRAMSQRLPGGRVGDDGLPCVAFGGASGCAARAAAGCSFGSGSVSTCSCPRGTLAASTRRRSPGLIVADRFRCGRAQNTNG
jgi:hypothetical protein